MSKIISIHSFRGGTGKSNTTANVAAVLPHSDEMMALASAGIFALRYPDHPVTATLKQLATGLVA
jgi:MinD-like ATPase involved in chromosome partitioning or flagellar assembly